MIPKVIHYCWFGRKKKPQLVRACIKSWKKILPHYQIIEWNEKNTNLSHPFVKEAYNLKKWAFVSDYIRLQKIYEYGGIYLDTDMMLIKNLDCFLEDKCFFGAEDLDFISCGIIGTVPQHFFINECLSAYDLLSITKDTDLGMNTIPRLITEKFNAFTHNRKPFDNVLHVENIVIYPSKFFYPFPFNEKGDLVNYRSYIKEESFAIHLWNSSWIEYSEFDYFNNSEYIKGFQKVFDKIIKDKKVGLQYIRKVASSIKRSFIDKR